MRFRNRIDKVTRHALVLMMGLLVIVVVWQVISRYLLNSPSTLTDEIARFLLIWISLLGAAYCSGQNLHIAINALPTRLNPENRKRLTILNKSLVIAFVLLVFVIGGGWLTATTFIYLQLTPTLQIPMGIVYMIAPICGLLIIYYKLDDLRLMHRSDATMASAPVDSKVDSAVTSDELS